MLILCVIAAIISADTVYVRSAGPAPTVHRLIEEVRIAPGADDTTLFTNVFDFGVDRAGRVWVFDQPSKTIFLFDRFGKLIRRVGRQGAGPGEFKQNNGMVALADTGIAFFDSQNGRISFFTSAGDFRTSWATPSRYASPNMLITDRSGSFLVKRPVAPPREGEAFDRLGLVRIKPGGAAGDSLVPPYLKVPRIEYVAENKGNRSASTVSTSPEYFWAWHPDGYFVVAHGGNYQIVVPRPGKEPLAIVRDAQRITVSDEERGEQRDFITWNLRNTDPGWSWTGPAIPAAKPPLSGLFIARDGRIWARVAAPSERIPAAEIVTPRDPRIPVSHFRTPSVYEIFTVDGAFLGRVPLPPRSRLIAADGNQVWLLEADADGLPAVVRYRIEPALR